MFYLFSYIFQKFTYASIGSILFKKLQRSILTMAVAGCGSRQIQTRFYTDLVAIKLEINFSNTKSFAV